MTYNSDRDGDDDDVDEDDDNDNHDDDDDVDGNMLVYLRDRYAQTIVHAATLR